MGLWSYKSLSLLIHRLIDHLLTYRPIDPLKHLASCVLCLASLLPSLAGADASLTHNVGSVEMIVSDWGALTRVENDGIYPNFAYFGKNYLDPFSEIWAGVIREVSNPSPTVASAYDGLDGDVILGEWQATTPSGRVEFIPNHPNASQCIHAQYAPDRQYGRGLTPPLPFNITVDQYTYAWDSTVYPDDDDYIIMELVLTNLGGSELRDFFLAVQTNWDVDYMEERDDLVDWDAGRRAGIAYDSDGTDLMYLALTLINGKFASHNIADASTWKYLDSHRADLMSNGETDDLKTIGSVSGNYFNVISTGPYTVPAGESVSAIYAFVAGQGLDELRKNIDAARKRVMTPGDLAAESSKEAIRLIWSQGISPDIANYKVYRSNTSGSGYSEMATVSAGNPTFTDIHTETGITYYYVITAIGPDGDESGYSNEVFASPGVAPPPPRNLTIRSDASANPVLHWEPPTSEEITGYMVFRNFTGSGPWTAIATVDTSVQSFVDQNVYDANVYYYTVAAINTYSWTSEYSNVVSMSIDLPKPSEPSANLNAVTVAPNPCNLSSARELRFAHLTAKAKIYVYTPTGELVKILYHTDGNGEKEWDLCNDEGATLASGIYIYYVESYKTEETGKFTASGKFALIK